MYQPPSPYTVPLESVDALRRDLEGLFSLTDTTIDFPEPGQVRFRGYFICDPADCYDELRQRFERHGFTPLVRPADYGVMVIALPTVFDPPESNWLINLVLFLITIGTTLYAGAINEPGFTGTELWLGWPFSLSMLLILGAHELGHYFAARYHNVPVTLPYFIPFPSFIGTMGAFIRLKAPIKNRRALLDIGAAGPLAGMIFAIPILIIGLATSPVGPPPDVGYYQEGNSVLYLAAKFVAQGECLPDHAPVCEYLASLEIGSGSEDGRSMDIMLNQMAWAGWVGLFVTGLNLIPVGQLDGGHVSYVLFGRRARRFFWPAIIGLAILALITGAATWWLWILLLFVFGRAYAQPLDDVTRLDPRRRAIAIFSLVLFFLVFVPVPIQVVVP